MCKINIEILYIFQEILKKHKLQKGGSYVYTAGDINDKTSTHKYSYKHFIVVYSYSLRINVLFI